MIIILDCIFYLTSTNTESWRFSFQTRLMDELMLYERKYVHLDIKWYLILYGMSEMVERKNTKMIREEQINCCLTLKGKKGNF